MSKSPDELLAMTNAELERYAGTLEAKSSPAASPWLLDELEDLKACLGELLRGDLGDATVVRLIAQVRRCIAYREAVERGENRNEAWAKAFDRSLDDIKRIQARAAEAAANLKRK